MTKVLPLSFFRRDDVLLIAKELLGKTLITNVDSQITGGIITETEAYRGLDDQASHAFGGKRTKRNENLYLNGGTVYVYFIYGMYYMLNIVTHKKNIPHAILIRAIKPTIGMDIMLKRRGEKTPLKKLTSGPGSLANALGIDKKLNGVKLESNHIWIEDSNLKIDMNNIITGPRVGIDYAGKDILNPWRFILPM